MSKAFINNESSEEEDENSPSAPIIPAGSKNYITPSGAKKLKDELHQLLTKDRPDLTQVIAWAASNGDRSENADYIYGKRRLREIDRRIHFLTKRIEAFEIIDPATIKSEQVLFGATVEVSYEDGQQKKYQIVGIDETDAASGKISWISPMARALLKAKKGDLINFQSPRGNIEIEIISVNYFS